MTYSSSHICCLTWYIRHHLSYKKPYCRIFIINSSCDYFDWLDYKPIEHDVQTKATLLRSQKKLIKPHATCNERLVLAASCPSLLQHDERQLSGYVCGSSRPTSDAQMQKPAAYAEILYPANAICLIIWAQLSLTYHSLPKTVESGGLL